MSSYLIRDKFLYVIKCDDIYKIGITSDIKKRMRQLSLSCPYPLELKYSVLLPCGANFVEGELHNKFSDTRTHGEWFLLDDSDLHFIQVKCDEIKRTQEMERW